MQYIISISSYTSFNSNLVPINNLPLTSTKHNNRIANPINIIRSMQSNFERYNSIFYYWLTIRVCDQILCVYVTCLVPEFEYYEYCVLSALYCFHSACVLFICEFCQPFYTLIFQLLPFTAECKESTSFLRSIRNNPLT